MTLGNQKGRIGSGRNPVKSNCFINKKQSKEVNFELKMVEGGGDVFVIAWNVYFSLVMVVAGQKVVPKLRQVGGGGVQGDF